MGTFEYIYYIFGYEQYSMIFINIFIVKQNIEKLGGEIQIEDKQSSGTTFVISLPHFLKKSA